MYDISNENPCELDGFAFLEFSGPDKNAFDEQFKHMGFSVAATHNDLDISLYQQGDIQFIVNAEGNCQAAEHAKIHGPGACAMGFKVKNARQAYEYALGQGAEAFEDSASVNHRLPAIKAIGGSVIYFVDEDLRPFANQWNKQQAEAVKDSGLVAIDHLTHNVYRGNMDKWAEFYKSIFIFREIRFFNIEGQMTGLTSRALSSPCNKIKIPLNESKDDHSQIEEFLHEYQGEGIQHIALSTDDIYYTIQILREKEIKFLDVPDTYYELLGNRIPWHQEKLGQLQEKHILMDGEQDPSKGLLLQIFTENTFGPVFFEIIQRKGNEGFGEGNFQALFEAIERDQIRRGALKQPKQG